MKINTIMVRCSVIISWVYVWNINGQIIRTDTKFVLTFFLASLFWIALFSYLKLSVEQLLQKILFAFLPYRLVGFFWSLYPTKKECKKKQREIKLTTGAKAITIYLQIYLGKQVKDSKSTRVCCGINNILSNFIQYMLKCIPF